MIVNFLSNLHALPLTLLLPDDEDAGVGDLLPAEVHEALSRALAVYLGQSPGPDRVWELGEAAVRVARHQPDLRHAPSRGGRHQTQVRRREVTHFINIINTQRWKKYLSHQNLFSLALPLLVEG